ncbi:MAG: tetratricopeptide repeat protein [Planctomycetota bacterium]
MNFFSAQPIKSLAAAFTSAVVLAFFTACQSADPSSVGYETPGADRAGNSKAAREKTEAAMVAFDGGDLEIAERLLKEALTDDVAFGPAHNNLGQVYFEQGRYYLAAWEFEYASKLMPYRPEPRNNLGLVLEAVRRYDEAVTQFQAAKDLAPDHPELIGNLARAKYRRGDRGDQLRDLLGEILLKDTRPSWRDWAENRLVHLDDPDDR